MEETDDVALDQRDEEMPRNEISGVNIKVSNHVRCCQLWHNQALTPHNPRVAYLLQVSKYCHLCKKNKGFFWYSWIFLFGHDNAFYLSTSDELFLHIRLPREKNRKRSGIILRVQKSQSIFFCARWMTYPSRNLIAVSSPPLMPPLPQGPHAILRLFLTLPIGLYLKVNSTF